MSNMIVKPESDNGKTVLLTAGRIPGALELARALGRSGHRVIIADSLRTHICRYSNTVARSYRVAPPSRVHDFARDILWIIEKEQVDVLIPTCEEAVHVSSFKDRIPANCKVVVDDFDKIIRLHSKVGFSQLMKELRLPAPETLVLSENQKRLPERFHASGYVVKREFSRGGFDICIFPPGDEAKQDLAPLNPLDRWIVQEFVPGKTLCSFSFAWEGRLLSTLTYEPGLKLGKLGVSFNYVNNSKIDACVKSLVEKTKYHGFISLDFIEDPKGDIWAIECNPRITSGIHLANPSDLLACLNGADHSGTRSLSLPQSVGSNRCLPRTSDVLCEARLS